MRVANTRIAVVQPLENRGPAGWKGTGSGGEGAEAEAKGGWKYIFLYDDCSEIFKGG